MPFKNYPIWLLLLLLLILHLLPMPAMAVSEDEITETLRCQCGCTMIVKDCSCETAAQIRGEVMAQIRAGDSEKQIFKTLEAKYGSGILAVPPKEVFDLSLLILPFIGVMVGGGILYRLARRNAKLKNEFEYEYQEFLNGMEKRDDVGEYISYEDMVDKFYVKKLNDGCAMPVKDSSEPDNKSLKELEAEKHAIFEVIHKIDTDFENNRISEEEHQEYRGIYEERAEDLISCIRAKEDEKKVDDTLLRIYSREAETESDGHVTDGMEDMDIIDIDEGM